MKKFFRLPVISSRFSNLTGFGGFQKEDRSTPQTNRQKQTPLRTRSLQVEPLEERALLAVTAAEYAALQSEYGPDFALPESMADINILEIEAENLSVASLKAAITEAGTTAGDDLILLRTTDTAHKITYATATDAITINFDSSQKGKLSIIGFGTQSLTIDANELARVMEISSTVNLGNLTITGGKTNEYDDGGGICNGGTLTITGCTISGNSADSNSSNGGGIYNSGTLTITGSTISGNIADSNYSNGGGIYSNYSGTLTITNSTISGNSATSSGGGIYNYGTLTMTNSIVSQNYSPNGSSNIYGTLSELSSNNLIGYNPGFVAAPVFDADGVLTNADTMDLHLRSDSVAIDAGSNTVVGENAKDRDGNPRIYNGMVDIGAYEYQGDRNDTPFYSSVVTTLNDSFDLTDNEWSLREAIYWMPEYTTITFTEDLSGTITLAMGQLSISCGLEINGDSRIVVDADSKSRVFYIESNTEVTLNGLTIQNGYVSDSGGGIYNYGGTLTISNCTISGNTANDIGGGICNFGVLTISTSTISDNFANTYGGGIYDIGVFTIISTCTISSNFANTGGGGICSMMPEITDSLIVRNSSSGISGIYATGLLTAKNITVSDNVSVGRDCSCIYGPEMNLNNCIVVQNVSGSADIQGSYVYGFNNLTTFTAWTNNAEENRLSDNNLTWLPAQKLFYDRVAGDYRLAAGSQAYNAGKDRSAEERDLAGNSRILDGKVDIGAYEYDRNYSNSYETPSLVVTTFSDITDPTDHQISLREAIEYARLGTLGTTITFDSSLKGKTIFLENGHLLISSSLTIDAASLVDNGPGMTIDAGNKSRVFSVAGCTTDTRVRLVGLNITHGRSYEGGGIYLYGTGELEIDQCMISFNTADRNGGGVFRGENYYDSEPMSLTVRNSVICGNSAEVYGGGLYSTSRGQLFMYGSTVAGNTAMIVGGGVYWSAYEIMDSSIANSIISDNFAPFGYLSDLLTCSEARDHIETCNIIGADACFVVSPEYNFDEYNNKVVLVNADTMDLHLSDRSWAINSGNNIFAGDTTKDLSGQLRIAGGKVDIGAYEYQAAVTGRDSDTLNTTIVTTLEDSFDAKDGKISLREAIFLNDGGKTITFAENLTGSILLNATLQIDSNINIRGEGRISLNGQDRHEVLRVSDGAEVNLSGLTISGGDSDEDSGGITNHGVLTITDCSIKDNRSSEGSGGISNSGTMTIINSTISGNSSERTGGISNRGTMTITNSTISGNSAYEGGGIYNDYGTAAQPIVFTSVKDDSFGGDTNEDNGEYGPKPGDWDCLSIAGEADIQHAYLFYGAPSNESGIIEVISNGTVNLDSCIISHAKYDGLWNWGGRLS